MSTELRDGALDERLLDMVSQDGPMTCQQLAGIIGPIGQDIRLVARLKALTDAGCPHRADSGLYSVGINSPQGSAIGPEAHSSPRVDAVERHLLAVVEEAEQALAACLGEARSANWQSRGHRQLVWPPAVRLPAEVGQAGSRSTGVAASFSWRIAIQRATDAGPIEVDLEMRPATLRGPRR